MDLQNIFYVVSIIFILMCIFMMAAVIFFMWKISRTVSEMKTQTVERVQGLIRESGTGVLGMVGMGLSTFVLRQVKNAFTKRRDRD